MRTVRNMQFDFGQPGIRLLVLWGSAAWAHNQTPGASARAAPRPFPPLTAGLTRLATAPLSAVLIILGAMGLLMFPAASLCGAAVQQTGLREKWKSNYTPRRLPRLHDHDKEK